MYASDLTNRKRAQVVFSDIARQKALFQKGEISRMTYQKGGTDYAYMAELEQGCINNKCIGEAPVISTTGNAKTIMDITNATYYDPVGLIDYGYILPAHSNPLQTGDSYDDVYVPLPMDSIEFHFFGQVYNAARPMYWSTNCAILFDDPGRRIVSVRSSPYPAILLGNSDRRLNNLYTRNDSISGKFHILTLLVFYENFSATVSTPNTGQYQVRIIRELTGFKRQWIEVRVKVAPASSGYIANDLTTDTDPVSGGNIFSDPTKLSPYNITDGTQFLNLCGTTFSRDGPAEGSSFTFESDEFGISWIFRNNTFVPV
jgi:hypothetical protein